MSNGDVRIDEKNIECESFIGVTEDDGDIKFDPKRYQHLILQFADGRKLKVAVPAFINSDSDAQKFKIVGIQVTKARELENDMSWSTETTK